MINDDAQSRSSQLAADGPPLHIITNKSELDGTAYIELLAGPYRGQCWVDGSVFLEEEVFDCIEPIFARHLPEYDHYAFTHISAEKWARISADLRDLKCSLLAKNADCHVQGVETCRAASVKHALALVSLIDDIVRWGDDSVTQHGSMTVLGM